MYYYVLGPEKVTGLVVDAVTTSSISITWDSVPHATSYVVQTTSNGASISEHNEVSTSTQVASLSPGTVYDFVVVPYIGSIAGSIPADALAQITGM